MILLWENLQISVDVVVLDTRALIIISDEKDKTKGGVLMENKSL